MVPFLKLKEKWFKVLRLELSLLHIWTESFNFLLIYVFNLQFANDIF